MVTKKTTTKKKEEVRFVENFIDASIEIAKGERLNRDLDDTDDEGNLLKTVRPDDPINRAEVSKIFTRLMELELIDLE